MEKKKAQRIVAFKDGQEDKLKSILNMERYSGATKVDAINAERSAILLALKIVNGRRRHCNYEICFDNQAAGYGADGTWRTDQASEIACRIRLLTLLIQQQGGKIRFQHVKAHSNQPQNDVADALAKLHQPGDFERNGHPQQHDDDHGGDITSTAFSCRSWKYLPDDQEQNDVVDA